ncbi:hypothetical protein FHE72_12345 [Rossellomorea vietnamensis]|uniref:Uncharacterized protein n=1 Tax=Rossellomorea vietnamensis TaxID=218284 RepID=A0A6I6UFR3_9BACI|nr:hypothetical protein [Rossellomorea vietnamensis]QHE61715.1 hypothetical protein FHE72_12345 [Rossellomorea vietnamensis]
MLQKRIQQYIDEMKGSDIPVHLFKQERDYVLNHGLLDADEVAARKRVHAFRMHISSVVRKKPRN